jgi:hypothetical protein
MKVPDEQITQQLVTELNAKQEPMELVLQPGTVFQLTALVQLACRHPHVSGAMREIADRVLAAVREYFADCPTVLDVVRRGDDPRQDVTR